MKKKIIFLMLQFMSLSIYAQTYVICEDVINAFLFNNFFQCDKMSLPKIYGTVVPFFQPQSVTGKYKSLRICSYNTEKYYGKDMKANEYPRETFYAYYNDKGNLVKIVKDEEEYLFNYKPLECSSGSNNYYYIYILKGYECYNKNTGKLLKEAKCHNIENPEWRHWGNDRDKWLVSNLSANYTKRNNSKITGFYIDFFAFFPQNRSYKVMRAVSAYKFFKPDWLERNIHKGWKNYVSECTRGVIKATDPFWHFSGGRFTYNSLGLINGEGMTPSEALSQGMRDGILYEYQWMY